MTFSEGNFLTGTAEIHAVHGFLGLPSDWNIFNFPNIITHNLFNGSISPSEDGFWEWAHRFNAQVESNGIYLGYSLGGRLGMHALLDNPKKWKAAIFVSAHTGIQSPQDRSTRLQDDLKWAERFKSDPWDLVLSDWNAQSVFGGMPYLLPREEKDFCREHLSFLLTRYSRGHQDNLKDSIQQVYVPILWICGEKDHKFQQAAKDLLFHHKKSNVQIIPGAAHRVPWEQPHFFKQLVHTFINEVS